MSAAREPKLCIYPGCERLAVPPHPLGGPQPAFCDREDHNALTAHRERLRLAALAPPGHGDELTTQSGEWTGHSPDRPTIDSDTTEGDDG